MNHVKNEIVRGEGDGVLMTAHSSVLSIINKTPLEQLMQQLLKAENHSFLSKKSLSIYLEIHFLQLKLGAYPGEGYRRKLAHPPL